MFGGPFTPILTFSMTGCLGYVVGTNTKQRKCLSLKGSICASKPTKLHGFFQNFFVLWKGSIGILSSLSSFVYIIIIERHGESMESCQKDNFKRTRQQQLQLAPHLCTTPPLIKWSAWIMKTRTGAKMLVLQSLDIALVGQHDSVAENLHQ